MVAWSSEFLSAADGMKVVCWDLDSSVRSTVHRRHLVPEIRAGRATWDDYSLLAEKDEPIEGAITLMRLLQPHHLNIAVSGTSNAALETTVEWCRRYSVPLEDFILRPEGDYTPNGVWKVSAVRRLQEAGLNVVLFVEDWAPSAAYIREHAKVPVLGVNPFDPGTVLADLSQLTEAMSKAAGSSGTCATDCAPAVFAYLEKGTSL